MSRRTVASAAGWKRLLLPAAMAALFGIAAPAVSAAVKGATAVMEQAIKQRSAGDLNGAIRNLRKAVDTAENPFQRSLARFMLGDCLMEAKKPDEASEIYTSILGADPTEEERAEALFRLAQCSKSSGDLAGMKKYCRQITTDHSDSPFAELAGLLSKSAAAEQAASEALTAAGSDPGTPAETRSPAVADTAPARPDRAQTASSAPAPSTRPVPVYEGVDQETLAALQSRPQTKPAPEPPAKPAIQPDRPSDSPAPAEPAAKTAAAPGPQPSVAPAPAPEAAKQAVEAQPRASAAQEPAREAVAPQAREPRRPERRGSSAETVDIADLVTLAPLSGEEREALATQILQDQEIVKANPTAPGADEVLARIAEATARFGEPVEACKVYDRILTEFPRSKLLERAYFEGIRLRAALGLKPMVSQWGKAFLDTFPKSRRADDVRRLVAWADRSAAGDVPARPADREKQPTAASEAVKRQEAAGASSREYAPEKDPRYRQAKRRVADNRFSLALNDFLGLTDAHPGVPTLWWELALVQIQLQRYDEAEESLTRLLALQPDNQDARSLLGYVHYHQKDYHQAADDYRQAGASESDGLKFFDSQTAARRMERSSKTAKPSSTREGENE
ncbi:MAG TPA: tetratricopeptide repeat protein [Candidatus Ozemobacteraceae bacterium]|nr:tetratricopeptide repeat protein [Candidatus Ozemobacteraceae bacterium]